MYMYRSKNSRTFGKFVMFAVLLCILIIVAAVLFSFHRREELMGIYHAGINEINNGNFNEGIEILESLGDYQDSYTYIEYANAKQTFASGNYEYAMTLFGKLGEFLDSNALAQEAADMVSKQEQYSKAKSYMDSSDFDKALSIYESLDGYEDSEALANKCRASLQRLMYSDTISAGVRYSAGVTADGNVVFSGRNFEDEMVIGTWDNIVSISSNGSFIIGLKNDGTVVTAQRSSYDYRIDASEWRDIVAVASGEHYIVGLRADGTVTAQGHNGDGQIDIDDWENIVAIDAGWRHTVGLDFYGNVHIAGYASENLLGYIEDEKELWTDLVNVSAGGGGGDYLRTFVVGLKADGTAVAVGANEQGQCNVDEWSGLIAISAGDYHTVGLKSDGTVLTTDPDMSIQAEISSWQDIVAISAGYGYTLGLKSDGTVVAAGFGADGQSNVDGWSNIAIMDEWSLLFDAKS